MRVKKKKKKSTQKSLVVSKDAALKLTCQRGQRSSLPPGPGPKRAVTFDGQLGITTAAVDLPKLSLIGGENALQVFFFFFFYSLHTIEK